MESVRALMSGVVDYAGLFPPAKLDMATAVRNYAGYLAGPHAWMLGRFIVPVARLDEFEHAGVDFLGGAEQPWLLSVLAGEDLEADLRRIEEFNESHARSDPPAALIDAVEIKATGSATVDRAIDLVPDHVFPFFEIATDPDPRGLIASLSGAGAAAKARTGGITPEAIPDAAALARFIVACAGAEVPFKATAGLHHALRGDYALTYDRGSATAEMHGFLNVLLGAGAAFVGRCAEEEVAAVLAERAPGAFVFREEGVSAHGHRLLLEHIAATREAFALSFGSCSFVEPLEELQSLNLLPAEA